MIPLLIVVAVIYILAGSAGRATADKIAETGSHMGIRSYETEVQKYHRNLNRARHGHPDPFGEYPHFTENFRGDIMDYEPLDDRIIDEDNEEEKEWYRNAGVKNVR